MIERSYYLTDYSDEITPTDGSLTGWAAWLSKPDAEWGRKAAAADGETFAATVLRFEADIVATRTGDEWSFSRDPLDVDFLAVRFAEGLGWSAESIISGADMAQALREWLAENGPYCEDVEHVAVAFNEPAVRVVYQAGPPAHCIVEALQ